MDLYEKKYYNINIAPLNYNRKLDKDKFVPYPFLPSLDQYTQKVIRRFTYQYGMTKKLLLYHRFSVLLGVGECS